MESKQNIRLGMVGCGAHSHTHAAAAKEAAGVDIVAACDVDSERAHAWIARYGGESAYDNLESMLAQTALDGVILCTWPNQHAEQIRVCLSSGVHNILCEKALVTSAEEAKSIWSLANERHANIVEASVHRHQPAIRKMEQILALGDIGPIDSVRAAFHNYEPEEDEESTAADWRYHAECGGGVPYDWMHYLVDSCNHFNAANPKRAFATGNVSSRSRVINRIYGMIEYENGRVGIVENSKLASFSNSLQITCAHGILYLPIAWAIQGEVTITQTRRKPAWDFILEDTYEIPKVNAYALQLENFRQVVRGTATPLVPLRDSIVNAITTEALVESLLQGRAVDIEIVDLK